MAISRRNYAEVIKFLKQTVKNEKASLRLRYAAAARLDDIFARHQQAEQRASRKKAGQHAAVPTDETNKIDEELEAELSAEEQERQREEQIFADILGPKPVAADAPSRPVA
jgi:uncharacterized protein YdeI (YjbR/CyaY-like superfamily)